MKQKSWSAPEGTDGAEDYILPVLAPHAALFALGGVPYTSRDMKVGMNVKQMLVLVASIIALIGVDSRGGIFGQRMMEAAMCFSRMSSRPHR